MAGPPGDRLHQARDLGGRRRRRLAVGGALVLIAAGGAAAAAWLASPGPPAALRSSGQPTRAHKAPALLPARATVPAPASTEGPTTAAPASGPTPSTPTPSTPETSIPAASAAPEQALGSLPPGRYVDGPAIADRWVLTVVDLPGSMFGGSAYFVPAGGRPVQELQYTAEGQGPGHLALTTSNGHQGSATYAPSSITWAGCGADLAAPGAPSPPSCTFIRS